MKSKTMSKSPLHMRGLAHFARFSVNLVNPACSQNSDLWARVVNKLRPSGRGS